MHAGVTTVQVQPDNMDELVDIFRESILPAAFGLGSLGTLVLTGRNIGKVVLIGFWESEAKAMELASSGALQELTAKIAPTFSGTAHRQVHEVSVEVPGGATNPKFARVNFRRFQTEQLDSVIQTYRESVAPLVGGRKGCAGTAVITARDICELISISLWETDADMRASLPPGDVDAIVGGPPMRELYEVQLNQSKVNA